MISYLKNSICLFSAFFLSLAFAQAQIDCGASLKTAVDLYDKGQYDKVIDLLADKIDNCKFTKIELEQALKVLASAYYDLDELEKGNKYMARFLNKNPNYHININQDPIPFIDAYDKFLVRPKFSWSVALGLNFTVPDVEKTYSIWEAADYTNDYERSGGFNFALGFQWNFRKNFSLNTELNILGHTYIRNISSPLYSNFNIRYEESFSGINIPFYLKYSFQNHRKIYPEVFAGVTIYQPVSPTAKITAIGDEDPLADPKEIESEPSVVLDNFRNLDGVLGIMYGFRINYHKNSYNLFFDWRYAKFSDNYNNPNNRFQNKELLNDFFFVDDDMKLTNSAFSIGLTYNFSYKVKYKY